MKVLPMFPLGSVIFPYTAIPLRVFEPRYQQLLDDVVERDRTFGSVLIERGPEVGGGDQRFEIGARVRIARVSPLPDGHRLVVVAGTQRIRVDRWLDDDPYPRAEAELYPDVPQEVPGALLEEVRADLARVMALASELGADTSEIRAGLGDDAVSASYQAAALTPVSSLDQYALLSAEGPATRLEMCRRMLAESAEMLTAQLGGGAGPEAG